MAHEELCYKLQATSTGVPVAISTHTYHITLFPIKHSQPVLNISRRSHTSSKLKGPLLSLSALPKYHSFSLSLFMSGDASSTLLCGYKEDPPFDTPDRLINIVTHESREIIENCNI